MSSSSKQELPLEDQLNELRASYGLAIQPSKVVVEILSSQEEVPSEPVAPAGYIQYMTPTEMIRLHKDGRKEVGKLVPGKNGFAVAVFGQESVATEVPSLLVTLPVMKKPAVAHKAPAAKASDSEDSGSQ